MPARGGVLLGFLAPALVLAQLRVSVTDKSGNPVLELPQSAFHVLVDGVEQPVRSFQPHETPISMGLVIDYSAKMRDKGPALRKAVLDVVDSSNAADEMFILGYNDTPYLDQAFTNDPRGYDPQSLVHYFSRVWQEENPQSPGEKYLAAFYDSRDTRIANMQTAIQALPPQTSTGEFLDIQDQIRSLSIN
jgi:VWFA-related protein